jgi:tetratricopeptide (TPR) repeat protein
VRRAKYLLVLVAFAFIRLSCPGQGVSNPAIWQDISNLDTNRSLGSSEKLKLLYAWKKKSETLQLPEDSVYARLLHKIGVYEFFAGKRYNVALLLTLKALRINTSGKAGSSLTLAVTDLFNIAWYYDNLSLLKKSLVYYDSTILFAGNGPDIDNVIAESLLNKAYIYFRMGDYEKALEESDRARTLALERRDSLRYLISLNQLAQALYFQGKLSAAREDARIAISLARSLHQDFHLAGALKAQGFILAGMRDFSQAEASFTQCIAAKMRSRQFQQVYGDYNDFGVFYTDSLRSFQKAATCYLLAIQYAQKEGDSIEMARASINLGRNYFYQQKLDKAMSCYVHAMDYLKIGRGSDLTVNPTAGELGAIGNKEMIQVLFHSKTVLLLDLYRQTHDPKWLDACLQTALLNDSLIREMRHEQVGEQSKLYWRTQTRDFFANALEACYLAHDDRLAFFFLEESRSVLLQDKLNELGAHAYLPAEEAAKEERLQINIVELQQKHSLLPDTSSQGRAALQKLLAAKESLEQYIRSLESNYPAYYQYKYADTVRPLASLQEFLSKNKQSFVEYFIQDTLCFALCVQPGNTRFVRIVNKEPGIGRQLGRFVKLCSDENALNSDFPAFLACSNGLFRLLLQPFHLPGGRIIICQDNGLIPFEALSTDATKSDFLVKNYAFSYVYSARYLMNQLEQTSGKGDFLGIAPVNFTAYNGLADLKLSEDALRNCSAPYHRSKLLLRADASRQNFIRQVCDYNTTTILTHARADSSDDEPILFMNDSVIHLSELQLLSKPAARLIILSACQTNVGKNRNGEGIFSLARGFSAAGIPAVAATQWEADEAAIYSISQKFNEYIFRGMNKDEALQKAKLYYIFQDKGGNPLPCYWADMILIGNTEPVQFSRDLRIRWVLPVVILGVLISIFGLYWVRRKMGQNTIRIT